MSDPNAFQPSSVEQPLIGLDALRHLLRVIFSHVSISRGESRREDVMIQLHLFPPPASPSAPLPSKACSEAKDLVASLLEALAMKCPAETYSASSRPSPGPPDLTYPLHDRDALVTACSRICMHRKRLNISTVLTGQRLGIK